MRFAPKSKEELQYMSLLPKGVYQFEVSNAEDTKSQAGNDMIKLTLKIYDKNGSPTTLFDYLLESWAYKLRHFAEVTGIVDKYDLGNIEAKDCLGKVGHAEIIIEEGKQKPDGSKYHDQNSIKDYIKVAGVIHPVKQDDIELNDDIPF